MPSQLFLVLRENSVLCRPADFRRALVDPDAAVGALLVQLPHEPGPRPAGLAREWQQATAAVIEDAIPGDTEPPEAWPICAALLPHAQGALANGSAGMARIADYLGWSGSYAAARDLQRRVLDARERVLGPEHPDTLATRAYLAASIGRAGDPAAARDQYAELLRVRERVLGPEHPDTLTAQYNLARWTGEEVYQELAARWPDAYYQLEQSLRLADWLQQVKATHPRGNLRRDNGPLSLPPVIVFHTAYPNASTPSVLAARV